MKNNLFKRIFAVILVAATLVAYLPGIFDFSASAAATSAYTKVADPHTMDNWHNLFGSNKDTTEFSGAVYFDKSVFTDVSSFVDAHNDHIVSSNKKIAESSINEMEPDSFLVALSAIASNKSIVGYSTVPTDTMLVLDVSGSMRNAQGQNYAADELADAANLAITELLALNKHNRVGVVLYSGDASSSAKVLLPLGRYTVSATDTIDNNDTATTEDDTVVGLYLKHSGSGNNEYISLNTDRNTGVYDEYTSTALSSNNKQVVGSTFIQNGIYMAMEEFLSIEDTVIEGGKFQAGTTRMPVMVLMSDGAPTVATNYFNGYTASGSTNDNANGVDNPPDGIGNANFGNGSSKNTGLAFLSQLTAAYAKTRIDAHYKDTTPLFYTLGLGVSNAATAQDVLNPSANTDEDSDVNTYWTNYNALTADSTLPVSGNTSREYQLKPDATPEWVPNRYGNGGRWEYDRDDYEWVDVTETTYVSKDTNTDIIPNRYYVDKYFNADDASKLVGAFDNIIQQIILQSLYRPTLVESGNDNLDGYIEIIDDIGEYMEVKDIKGIVIGDTVFTGAQLSKNFNSDNHDLGTIANPSELGNNMIWAIIERLGIEGTYAEQVQQARALVGMAFRDGQLSYTSDSEFSNYIGWYADKDGKYIGFWDKDDKFSDVPANAVYVNKSYGLMGKVTDGVVDTDMMYISIQVHTAIDKVASEDAGKIVFGAQQVVWKVPAALIPIVSYNVEIEGVESLDDITENTNIDVTIKESDPIRLLFEAGLKDEINAFNVSDIVMQEDIDDANIIINAGTTPPAAGSEEENIALKDSISVTKNDTSYSFYTNKWNSYIVNKENAFPFEEVNAIGFFEPSEENERYFYAEDTKLYIKDGNEFIKYSGETPQYEENKFFHAHLQFVKENGKWKYTTTYHDSTEFAVGQAVEKDGVWVIPKGTPHFTPILTNHLKADNPTDSLNYSAVPLTEYHGNNNPPYYYFDMVLGNNGMITVNAQTGIKLSKAIDDTIANVNEVYTFTVEAPNGTSFKDASIVTFNADTETISPYDTAKYTKNDSLIEIKLKAGQEVYITGLTEGVDYTVKETVNASDSYKVSNITVDKVAATSQSIEAASVSVTVNKGDIRDVEFTNTFNGKAALVIDKTVTHDMAIAPSELNTKEFEITIYQKPKNGAVGQTEVQAISNKKNINSISFTEENGVYIATYNIVNGETIELIFPFDNQGSYELTVAESAYTNFRTTYSGQASGELTADSNMGVNIVNDYYTDDSVKLTDELIFTGTKNFTGRDWNDTDRFEFKLEEYVPQTENGQYIGMIWKEVTDTPAEGDSIVTKDTIGYNFSLADALSKIQPYTSTGTHLYRVTEINDGKTGITYDGRAYEFEVTVTDNDMDGNLEISNVSSTTMAVINKANSNHNKWEVSATFNNSYKAAHGVEVTFKINKSVTTSSGAQYSPEGFEFGLYSTDSSFNIPADATPIGLPVSTDAHGNAVISNLIYLPALLEDADDENIYYYAIAETNSGITNMEYINRIPVTVRVYDAGNGYLAADVTVGRSTGTNANGSGSVNVQQGKYNTTVDATAQNYFTSPKVDITLSGTKTVNGAVPTSEYGTFSFKLEKANYNTSGDITGWEEKETVSTTAGSSDFSFSKIEYATIGNHTYRISEVDPNKNGITYDKSVYEINVAVEDSGENNGTMKTTVITKRIVDANGNTLTTPEAITSGSVAFNNIYDAQDLSVVLEGTKQVNGEKPGTTYPGFTFKAVTGADEAISQPNDGNGKFSVNLGTFSECGKYTYLISEVMPAYEGYDYDLSEYEITINISDEENNLKTGILKATATIKKVKDENGNPVTENGASAVVSLENTTATVDTDIVFNNIYAPEQTTVTLEGEKLLNGRDLANEEFTFVLNDGENDIEAKNKDGKFKFELTYSKEDIGKTFTYTLYEKDTETERVTFDKSVYEIKVKVLDNDKTDGKVETLTTVTLVKDKDGKAVNEAIAENSNKIKLTVAGFENIYTPKPEDVSVIFKVDKSVKNNALSPEGFSFKLTGNGVEETVKTDKNGDAKFTLSYSEEDIGKTYTYKLFEVNEKKEHIIYDDTVYEISVTVKLDENNKLITEINKDSAGEFVAQFENIYDVEPPYTGDRGITPWIILLVISFISMSIVLYKKVRTYNN